MSRLEAIVAACGGILLDGGKRALIPGPDHSTKDRSVSLAETDEGRILIHCFSPKDDWREVRAALRQRGLLDAPASSREVSRGSTAVLQPIAEERLARAQRIWAEGRDIRCTPASAYLRRRSIETGSSEVLRFHPRMTSADDKLRRLALLAAITGADGNFCGVQVTLLSAHGAAKAAVPTPRRIIGRLLGGAVRLRAAGSTLVVAEGVESALSAADALSVPAWAALTAHNLSRFEPPDVVSELIIARDADKAGLTAAETLRSRLLGRIVIRIEPPPEGACDWNAWACAVRR